MGSEERQHAERILYDLRRRLRYREQQKVRLGDSADPSVDADIEQLKAEIDYLKPVTEPEPREEVKDIVRRHIADDYLFIYTQVAKLVTRTTKIEERVAHVEEKQDSAAKWRDATTEAMVSERSERIRGQRRNLALLIVAVGGVLVVAAILVYLLT